MSAQNVPDDMNDFDDGFSEYSDGDDFDDADELAAYADDSDEDPDYFDDIDPEAAALDARAANAAAAIALKDDFLDPPSASEDENDIPEDANVIDQQEMAEFHTNLKAAQGFKKGLKRDRKGGRRAIGEEPLSFEVQTLMGDANGAYGNGDLDKALEIIQKVIRIDGNVYTAWKLLGEIFKEKGEAHKCLLAYMTAAHAMPKDWELWLVCAKMSLEQYGPDRNNYRDQAIYCFSQAIRANRDNIDAIYDRAILYKEKGDMIKAAEGFRTLHRLLPNDMTILRDIASLFIEIRQIPEAIEYYNRSIEFFVSTGNPDKLFGWSELNILVELYMMNEDWKGAIKTLRRVGRWLCGRSQETFWDKTDDDREWDADNTLPETYSLPTELRVKLGVCRLKTGKRGEAILHFKRLEEVDPASYYDLFQEAGDALYEAKAHEEALKYYSHVVEGNQYLDRKVWFNIANCYKALNQVDDAEDCYTTILEAYPTDTDAMMELASIYEVSGRKAEALEYVNEVITLRKERDKANEAKAANGAAAEAVAEPTGEDTMAFFPNQPAPRRSRKKKPGQMTIEQRAAMNARKTEQAAIKYKKLEYLRAGMEAGDPEAIKEWLDTAGDLVDDFRNTKALFPSEKGKAFKGFVFTATRRANAKGDKERLKQMQHRLEESVMYEDDQPDTLEDQVRFRGLDFDTWLYIFMQYALCLAKHDNYLDAYDVCSVAKEANVFYLDKRKIFVIWTTWLACAVWVHDSESCSTITRWFMSTYQFQTEAYMLFVGSLTMSRNGMEVFHNNANQKFLLRQIKIMDEIISGTKRQNAASLTNVDEHGNEYKPERLDATLLMLYGHILASGKSYLSALNYYTRAYTICPKNPIVLLSIGLAYLHRSMQRQSENRHMQALQAITFMFEYYEARCAGELVPLMPPEEEAEERERVLAELRQEAEFNIARSFHHLGATHLALPYYQRCLDISDEWKDKGGIKGDLKWEAAYMLEMVYITSGNPQAAMEVAEKWLVIE
ncbi:Similar to Transcription factor tau subunit sfc4; acc. no. O74458 [Pyronema omphalodes CBS 100304]|uniref:Similar to Transcription factor tau subunit sfc4 acc. no. O74458 n=1 Tax=Pyronema omphalodes (strain CBS 100304) TaxID=1076935 RepID=U4L871_PYROM|nr:Similar to Transcription factor tau subunit sfc4; acc. no. O74458 [Pyronema omphalodes CBS 100304]